ncbi:zinc finger protein 185 [Labrus bergylta]|uniref:zinc finger protein 185 n=1 Tax=Labrus bergylta TaxID=56723 RepID=UPI0010FBB9DE|nr:zinc finger protein 185-like [Labrus bergylta]
MSKEVDRKQVFQTTRVRTSLKNDLSWIQKSKQPQKEQENARTEEAVVETKPSPVRQSSYVLSTIKKFEPEAPAERTIQNDGPEISISNTIAENKGANADASVDKINGEHIEVAAEVSADVLVEECIHNGEAQPVSSAEDKAKLQVANSVAILKEEVADTTVEEAKISADTTVEDHVVHVALPVEVKTQEKPAPEPESTNATLVEDGAVEPTVQSTEESHPPEQAAKEMIKSVVEVSVESSSDKTDVTDAKPGEDSALQESVEKVAELLAESESESPTQAVTEESCEKDVAEETVEATAAVESSLKTPDVTQMEKEEAAPGSHKEPVPDLGADTVSVSPTKVAAEPEVKSVACEESAASAEPLLKTTVEEVVECEIQPVVEQSVEPAPESAADPVVDDAEAAQDTFTYRVIELTDALDEETATDEVAPEPATDLKEIHTEETKVIQDPDVINDSEVIQKPVEEQQPTYTLKETSNGIPFCSFCDKIIDGNIKISFSEPLVRCHPDCLKCGVCAQALGDFLTPMFLHNQVIQCDGCFAKALKT